MVIGCPLGLCPRRPRGADLGPDGPGRRGGIWNVSRLIARLHAPIVESMRLFKRRQNAVEAEEQVEVEPAPTLPDPPAVDAKGRRSMAAQRDYLLSLVAPLPAFGMYLLDAWGSAVCEDIAADTLVPEEDLVAATGFAVRAADLAGLEAGTRATLRVRDDDKVAKVGSAVRVRAGQPLPEGADAVIPAEQAQLEGNVLTVRRAPEAGDGVRWAGSEVRVGVPILRNGERLDARRSGLLALAGIDRVLARPRPRVVVLSVAGADSDPADVESHILAASLRADGAQVWRVGLQTGSDRELQDAISDQLIRADLVVASGDLAADDQLARVVAGMGLLDLADVALEPGGRIGFALIGEDEVPLVMLADDAVDAYVGYQVFVRPLVRKLAGAPVVNRETVSCLAGGELPGGREVMQVRFGVVREQQGEKVVVPLRRAFRPRLTDLVNAEAMIIQSEKSPSIGLGERVNCWLLDD